jgi:hypothetical protein
VNVEDCEGERPHEGKRLPECRRLRGCLRLCGGGRVVASIIILRSSGAEQESAKKLELELEECCCSCIKVSNSGDAS